MDVRQATVDTVIQRWTNIQQQQQQYNPSAVQTVNKLLLIIIINNKNNNTLAITMAMIDLVLTN